ncbi:MAG TPA: hypothetical protein VKV16_07055 [Solirubrobacteraceae bacterium]|nr:hypothetical protein [Solirubrobacteraceae bacterium]
MPYTDAEARQQLLDAIAEAVARLAVALAALSELYERVDEGSADALEERLFRPLQRAYGRARSAHTAFAERHGLPTRTFAQAQQAAPALGTRQLLDGAVDAVTQADGELAGLQDSMLPVEVGDRQLRAELEGIRTLLGALPARARELQRTLGR